ncbi:tRNA-splicing endonuclease subunit [Pseudocyphellaria aurata]|nr:tRNA-splicing endonuclease subunit [Pseudocyphellaria aurata]
MDCSNDLPRPPIPFPLFKISSTIESFLLYDINTIMWLRKSHNILGVLIGTLPQFPQQNVFLGLPLELQPEEARLLVEMELAYIVDDLRCHSIGMQSTTAAQKEAFIADLKRKGREAAKAADSKREASRKKTLKRLSGGNQNFKDTISEIGGGPAAEMELDEDVLFNQMATPDSAPIPPLALSRPSVHEEAAWTVTPATSYPPLQTPPMAPAATLPIVKPSAYALFKHLHSLSYFLTPGLRFGCQFSVYPGDPLRFHSHFLAVGTDWDEEIDLLDLIGGGRLGTGVKKGWLIGGVDEEARTHENQPDAGESKLVHSQNSNVRTFCIEWGGM